MTSKEALRRRLALCSVAALSLTLCCGGAAVAAVPGPSGASEPARLQHADLAGFLATAPSAPGHVHGMPTTNTLAALGALGPMGPLIELVVRRLRISDQVAAAKRGTGSPIDDPARERQELDEVRRPAAALGLDPTATARFFEDQISASKIVQRGLLARWRERPAEAPAERPSLGAIRGELDSITTEMLRELVTMRQEHDGPAVSATDGTAAEVPAELTSTMDALHREALRTALRSLRASG